MNVSELARILRVPIQELREILPQVGFDIGAKAIKVDEVIAMRIIKDWPRLYREYLTQKEKAKKEAETETRQGFEAIEQEKIIKIPHFIRVKNFSHQIGVPLVQVMQELMKNGVLATLNDKIDFETAAIIADEFGFKAELAAEAEKEETEGKRENEIKMILGQEKQELLKPRPPVVVVMGHVDHGKTKLLDTIRKTNVAAGEAGGITQHIGAYQAEKTIAESKEKRKITFIDTPGHEAFTAMRSRGAKIADIAILVVAADDGVKPQTQEAIKIIEQANIPIIVAINKIDKPEANIDKTKQELSALNLAPEDWGGKTVCVPVSAKEGTGIDDLLETIILTADLNDDKIKANPSASGLGTVIESHIDKGEGPVATILVQNGTIKKREYILICGDIYGRIRSMKNHLGHEIKEAAPSTPVKIIGFKAPLKVGDIIKTTREKIGKKLKKRGLLKVTEDLNWQALEGLSKEEQEEKGIRTINLILKADVVGSLEAIIESLAKIESEEVKIDIVKKGLGNISEADILMAEASQAIVIGFNVLIPQEAEKMAIDKDVEFYRYKIIYELLGFIKEEIKKLTKPKFENFMAGKAKVLAIFRTEHKRMIIGGKVTEGEAKEGARIKINRDGKIIDEGELESLQSAKQKVNVCSLNQECGIQYKGAPVIIVGDALEFWIKREKR